MDMYQYLFLITTLWIGPFWGLMLVKTDSKKTKKIMDGNLFFFVPILVWFILFISNIDDFIFLFQNSQESLIARISYGLSTEIGFVATWSHIVVGDIFVTRWIWRDSYKYKKHNIARKLAIFFGVVLMPLGVILNIMFRKYLKTN